MSEIITIDKIRDGTIKKLSLNALSEATGIDKKIIKKRLVEAGLYPPDQYPRDEVIEAIKPLTDARSSSGIIEKLKAKIYYENWRKLKLANDKQQGKLIERAEVNELTALMAGKIKSYLESKLIQEYPTIVAGLNVIEAREYGRKLFEEICQEIQSWADLWKV